MNRIRIYSYNCGSKGAKNLAEALGGKVLRHKNSKYRRRPEDLIINWGAVDSPFNGQRVANQPDAIKNAQNKLTCFKLLKEAGVRVPDFWERQADIPADAYPVFARKYLCASEGKGIVEMENADQKV